MDGTTTKTKTRRSGVTEVDLGDLLPAVRQVARAESNSLSSTIRRLVRVGLQHEGVVPPMGQQGRAT